MFARLLISCFLTTFFTVACSPEVGSRAWCEQLDEKSKGDWTVNEAEAYVRNCIVRSDD